MASKWHVLHHGKLMVPKTDSIVQGSATGFTTTAQSAEFPPELKAFCDPRHAGVTDQTIWVNFHWLREQSTLALRPACQNGRWYLYAIRLYVRGEDTGGKSGRYFHQTAHLFLPLSELKNPLDLLALNQKAKSRFSAEKELNLPRVEVAGEDASLPKGWFDRKCQLLLAAVVSEQAIAVRGLEKDPDIFFLQALCCAACLPASIRWRVPIGSGFFETPEGFGIAHGQNVKGKVRYVEGDLRKGDVSLERGEEYVEWIKPEADKAASVSELMTLIDKKFAALPGPNLAVINGISDEKAPLPWTQVMPILREAMQFGKLKEALETERLEIESGVRISPKPGCGCGCLGQFKYFCVYVVTQVFRSLGLNREAREKRAQELGHKKPDTDEPTPLADQLLFEFKRNLDWRKHWLDIAGQRDGESRMARTLGVLMGILQPLAENIHPAEAGALPASETRNGVEVLRRLSTGLANRPAAEKTVWAALIQASGKRNPPPVLAAWRRSNEPALVWTGINLELSSFHCVAGWDENEVADISWAACSALNRIEPEITPWTALCQSADREFFNTAEKWSAQLMENGLTLAAFVLAAQLDPNAHDLLPKLALRFASSSQEARRRGAAALAAAIQREHSLAKPFLSPILDSWDLRSKFQQDQALPGLEKVTSPPFRMIVFGTQIGSWQVDSNLYLSEENSLPGFIAGHDLRQRWFNELRDKKLGITLRDALRRVFLKIPLSNGRLIEDLPEFRFLEAAKAGAADLILPELPANEAEDYFETAARMGVFPKYPPNRVQKASQLMAFAVLAGNDLSGWWTSPGELDRFFPDLVTELARQKPSVSVDEFWLKRISAPTVRDKPVFRLLHRYFVPTAARFERPYAAEEIVLKKLGNDDLFYRYYSMFERCGEMLLSRLSLALSDSLLPELLTLEKLAMVATQSRNAGLYSAILRSAFRRLKAERASGTGEKQGVFTRTTKCEHLCQQLIERANGLVDANFLDQCKAILPQNAPGPFPQDPQIYSVP